MASVDTADVRALLEDLEVNIDELESALEPLLTKPLSQTVSNLPLLDRAKLYATTVYAIENLIFNALRVAGIDPATHPVKTELDRVKQYFAKIKDAETPAKQSVSLDKHAAGRFIKAALSGNERFDREREEAIQRNRDAAQKKLAEMETKKRKVDENLDHDKKNKRHKDDHSEPADSPANTLEVDNTPNGASKQIDPSSRPKQAQGFRKQKSNQPPLTGKEVAQALKKGPLSNSGQKSKKANKAEKKKAKKMAMQPVTH